MRSVCVGAGAPKQGSRGGAHRAAVRTAANAALTLPRLLPVARQRYVQCERGAALGKVALALLDEGLLDDKETGESVDRMVVRGISNWLGGLFGDMQWFDIGCSIHDSPYDAIGIAREDASSFQQSDAVDEAVASACGVHPEKDQIALAFTARGRNEAFVGKGVRGLNMAAEGLGWACLDAVERVGIHYEMLTFSWAEMAVSQSYWYGGESEEDWANECEEDVSQFDGVTKAQFDAAVPPEVFARRKRPTKRQIDAWCASAVPEVAEAASLLKSLYALGKFQEIWTLNKLNEVFEWYETLEQTVWMMWDEVETMRRIGDDYFQSQMECGEQTRPVLGIASIPLDGSNWFKTTGRRWRKATSQLRIADKLLCVLNGMGVNSWK